METLLDRFCRYVKIDTQAAEDRDTYPSTPSQVTFANMLADELRGLGLSDVTISEHGIVMATVPATTKKKVPTIAFNAHVDTSPETSGANIKPTVHRNYDGKDIVLPGDPSKIIRVSENPALQELVGKTLVTTDGTTLLGADDKAGIVAIVEAAIRMLKDPSIEHGPVRLLFTCDEEIGRGISHVDLGALGAVVAYTLDGEGHGKIDSETFSADLATVTIRGVNTHPSEGKGRMVNAIRIAADFVSRMPWQRMSPETTDGRDGFMHPYVIEGGVAEVTIKILLRDFETPALAEQAKLLESIAVALRAEHPRAAIDVVVKKQYRNMRDGLVKEPRAVAFAQEAMRRVGIEPKLTIIRGGTDGSGLTEKGLPTPNLSTGEHNPHSPLEWTCVEEIDTAANVLVELARVWAEKA